VHWLSYRQEFSIQNVSVTGAQLISPQLVSDYVESILNNGSHQYLSRTNIFLYPKTVIERDVVANFPLIKSAQVSRSSIFSTTLDVSITERTPYALWCQAVDNCYVMDDSGFIFAPSTASSSIATSYAFTGGVAGIYSALSTTSTSSTGSLQPSSGQASSVQSVTSQANPIGQVFAASHLSGLVALLTLLGQSGFSPSGASVENEQDFTIPLAQGYFLKASFGESPDQLVHNLQLVLSSDALRGKQAELEYIDLRFGNRVYYKFVGQPQSSGQ
jgi:cell division septal protein FtsQ